MFTEAASLPQFGSKTEHGLTGTEIERSAVLHSDRVLAKSFLSLFATVITAKLSSVCIVSSISYTVTS